MLAFLSTNTSDLTGHVTLKVAVGATRLGNTSRRLSRAATLDGGVVVNDGGFSAGDATIVLAWTPHAATDAAVRRLVETYSTLTLSVAGDVYVVAPDRFEADAAQSKVTLFVTQRLTP